ncbi:MAG TPA: GYF domain-containing protein [Micropepsaceae bacterium]|jgi:hypothetical protein
MSRAWTINAGGQLYGPFSSERMRGFASEGRLAPNSQVARENATDWHEARDEPEFADLFALPPPLANPSTSPANPRPVLPSSPAPVLSRNPAPTNAAGPEGQRTQFAVIVDVKSLGSGNLEKTIASFGPSYRLLPNVWLVSTEQSVNALRNRLIQELGKSDSLFVVDATRGKAAWFNFGPDADVNIRRVWQKPA